MIALEVRDCEINWRRMSRVVCFFSAPFSSGLRVKRVGS